MHCCGGDGDPVVPATTANDLCRGAKPRLIGVVGVTVEESAREDPVEHIRDTAATVSMPPVD